MVDFFIKSILSLGILYVFHWAILSRLKTFNFNRYFLLGSLVFSLLIPFVNIPVDNTTIPLFQSTGNLSMSSAIEYSGEFIATKEIEQNSIFSFLPYFYFAISLLLFIRFSVNLFNIIKSIYANQKIKKEGFSIVLLSNHTIPYSFFKYVLADKYQYQNGAIDDALIQHEIAHCRQWHSYDILVVELLKIFIWINPFIWLMKKPIQLNHEYLADQQALSNQEYHSYKKTLINLVLKNNQGILVSNFNFSLTKQRLKMMTKKFSPVKAIVGKIASIFALILITISIACDEKTLDQNSFIMDKDYWWKPIVEAHNIEPTAYNAFDNIFEMGSKNSITNGVVTLQDAYIIFKIRDGYSILKSPLAFHDLENKTISAEKATVDSFRLTQKENLSTGKIANHQKFENLELQFKETIRWKADKMESDPISQNL